MGTVGVDYSGIARCLSAVKSTINSAEFDQSILQAAKLDAHGASGDVDTAITEVKGSITRLEDSHDLVTGFAEDVKQMDEDFAERFAEVGNNHNLTGSYSGTFSRLLKNIGFQSAVSLQNSFPMIDGTKFGGNQWWFSTKMGRVGGCGTTSATNILAYMALNNPDIAAALGLDTSKLLIEAEYTAFMEQVYQCVTPMVIPGINFTIGIWPPSELGDATVKFASQNGVNLSYQSLTVSDITVGDALRNGILSTLLTDTPTSIGYSEGIRFIQEGLSKDCPIALLNTFNPVAMTNNNRNQSTQQHWVTITDMKYDYTQSDYILTVSSWGERYEISYNELYESWQSPIAIDSGMLYFEYEGLK